MSGKNYTNNFRAVKVACPFYKGEEKRAIRCEGVLRGSTLVLYLKSEKRTRAYMASYCHDLDGCKCCPIHRMMMNLYTGAGGA